MMVAGTSCSPSGSGALSPASLTGRGLATPAPHSVPRPGSCTYLHLPTFFLQDMFLSPKARLQQEDEEPCDKMASLTVIQPTAGVCCLRGPWASSAHKIISYCCSAITQLHWLFTHLRLVFAGARPVQEEKVATGVWLLWLLGEGWGCHAGWAWKSVLPLKPQIWFSGSL